MIRKLLFYVFCIALTGYSCSDAHTDATRDIRSFYFPISALEEGRVYEYHPIGNDTLPVEYWYYKTVKTDSATYLTGNYYDNHFVVRQFFSEEVVRNGTLLHQQFLYLYDSTRLQSRVPAEIINATVFPFEVKDSGGVFLFTVKWTFQQEPLQSTTLTRNRRYMGDTTYTYKGEEQKCIALKIVEEVDDFNNGHWTKLYEGKELYAEDIGLIFYQKNIEQDFVIAYELKDTYPMEDFEKKFDDYLENR